MTFQHCLIVERADDWWIVVGPESETLPADASADEIATCAQVMARMAGIKQVQCVLAPASTSCFFARFDVSLETDLRDRVELTYALEDHLPIDAESMVADFARVAGTESIGKRVAAVALAIQRWKPIADALESRAVSVRNIIPASLLAVGALVSRFAQHETVDYFIVQDSHCDWVRTDRGAVIGWKYVALDPDALTRLRLLQQPDAEVTVVVTSDLKHQQMIEQVCGRSEVVSESIGGYKLEGAELALRRRLNTFELRRDQLGPPDPLRPIQTPLRFAVAAAFALLIAIAAGGWFRAQRIEAEIAEIQLQQRTLFRTAFPESRVPAALLRRVRSEHARVMASRGRSGEVELPISATRVLRHLLIALPDDLRYRVTRIDVNNGQLDLDLQVRSPVDAGTLASHLSAAGFAVKPPVTTQSDARTFQSSLEARWSGSPTVNEAARVSIEWTEPVEGQG